MKRHGIAYDRAGRRASRSSSCTAPGGRGGTGAPLIEGLGSPRDGSVVAADLPGHGESDRAARPTATTAPSATPPRSRIFLDELGVDTRPRRRRLGRRLDGAGDGQAGQGTIGDSDRAGGSLGAPGPVALRHQALGHVPLGSAHPTAHRRGR